MCARFLHSLESSVLALVKMGTGLGKIPCQLQKHCLGKVRTGISAQFTSLKRTPLSTSLRSMRIAKTRRRISRKPKATVFLMHFIAIIGHLLHQTPFTPYNVYNKQFLHQAPFTIFLALDTFYTRHLLHQTIFSTNNFYTRHPLHQKPFTPDTFYTRHLLHQTPCPPPVAPPKKTKFQWIRLSRF